MTNQIVNTGPKLTCGEGISYYDPRRELNQEVRNALYEQIDMYDYIGDTTWRFIIHNYILDETFLREFIEYLSLRQWHQIERVSEDFERELVANYDLNLEAQMEIYMMGNHGICI